MALDIKGYPRVFTYKNNGEKVTIEDPNPELSADEVLTFLSGTNSALTTATIDGPRIEDGKAVYEFKTTVGTKG